jgi:hypothetical protein
MVKLSKFQTFQKMLFRKLNFAIWSLFVSWSLKILIFKR